MSDDPRISVRRLPVVADARPFPGTVPGRLARLLLDAAVAAPRPRLSKSDMADITGTTWQGVTAALDALRAEGLIGVDRHQITITDRDGLRASASRDGRKR